MRGHGKILKSLHISGIVYLDIVDEEEILQAQKGDFLFYPVMTATCIDVMRIYSNKGYRGYFKAKIFDGYNWCHVDMLDFFEDKQNHFSKSEIAIYTYELCKDRIEALAGTELFRSYREHYTLEMPEREGFKGRKDSFKNK